MRIHAYPCLIAFLVFSLSVRAAPSPAPDAFLDQPVPSTAFSINPNNSTWHFKSYAEQVAKIRATIPKPIILPDDVVDFVNSVYKGDFVTVGFGMFFGIIKEVPTNRKFLDAACPRLEMA